MSTDPEGDLDSKAAHGGSNGGYPTWRSFPGMKGIL